MNVLNILKEKFIGTTMQLFCDLDGHWHYSGNGSGIWRHCTIVNVVYVDIVVDASGKFQSYDYFKLVFDCGYELELNME
jgi:hypothetical protein